MRSTSDFYHIAKDVQDSCTPQKGGQYAHQMINNVSTIIIQQLNLKVGAFASLVFNCIDPSLLESSIRSLLHGTFTLNMSVKKMMLVGFGEMLRS